MSLFRLKVLFLAVVFSMLMGRVFAQCVDLTGAYYCPTAGMRVDVKTEVDDAGNYLYEFTTVDASNTSTVQSFVADGNLHLLETSQGTQEYIASCVGTLFMRIIFIGPGGVSAAAEDRLHVRNYYHYITQDTGALMLEISSGRMEHEKPETFVLGRTKRLLRCERQ